MNQIYGFIYMTTNNVNGKSYIGMCSSKPRFNRYLGSGKILIQAIKKYGRENFTRKILQECYSEDELRAAEKYWIEYYNANLSEQFYNIAAGGRGGNGITGRSTSKDIKEWWSKIPKDKRTEIGKKAAATRLANPNFVNPMKGRSAVKENNLKWYTDGVKNLYVTEGTEPQGFKRGRTMSKTTKQKGGLNVEIY